ncbi:MAG: hypothetical protein P4L31_03360 [Candidatus Babeliales bacterium]|nr:hypothetical protein [Candidatus Babeliales bacterium]
MKRVLILASCMIASHIYADVMVENRLNLLELDAQKAMQGFNDLTQNMSIATVSESIVSHNAQMLESALGDLVNLNKTVNSQVNVAVQFWNMYLDTVKVPTMDTYLLGQVMNSLIGTIRALSLRSSVDQAMILSFIKTNFNNDDVNNVAVAVEAKEVTIEDRWQSMRVQ